MAHSATTNNAAEYWGLVHGLRQAKASRYAPSHVIGDSATVLSQLRTHHPPRKPSLRPLLRAARAMADDISVSSWGHQYRPYNKMADRLANIAMDTKDSIQAYASGGSRAVLETTAFLDNDVNHWLEASHAELQDLQGPAMTPRNLVISRRDSECRSSPVRNLVILSL